MKSAGAVADVKYQLSQMRREKGEDDEQFACRLFNVQMAVYSANAGTDLVRDEFNAADPNRIPDFDTLPVKTRADWIKYAKRHTKQYGYAP